MLKNEGEIYVPFYSCCVTLKALNIDFSNVQNITDMGSQECPIRLIRNVKYFPAIKIISFKLYARTYILQKY
jgi:hypothetical protein